MINKIKFQNGQAVITVLFIMIISVSIITALTIMIYNSVISGSNMEQGEIAYYSAETGAQNAILRLLRDPNYAGETLSINDGTVVTQVSAGIITSTAHINNSIRKVEVQTVYNNNVLTVSSWKEIN